MGCGASRDGSAPGGGGAAADSPPLSRKGDGGGDSKGDGSTEHKLAAIKQELENLPPGVVDSFGSLKGFKVEQYLQKTTKPLSLLAFVAISEAAERLGMDPTHLPKFVGTVGFTARKEGSLFQRQRLHMLQFLHSQQRPGGALHSFANSHPLHMLALLLAGVVHDSSQLSASARKSRKTNLGGRKNSNGNQTERQRAVDVMHSGLIDFLANSMFLRQLEADNRTELLRVILETFRAASPKVLKQLLAHGNLLQQSDKPMFIAQTSLVVAGFSHIFRTFKVHHILCEELVNELKDAYVSPLLKARFSFTAEDMTEARYARTQGWFLKNVLLTFLTMWLKATCEGVEAEKNDLYTSANKLLGSYEMMTDMRVVNGASSVPIRVPIKLRTSTYSENDKTSLLAFKPEDSWILEQPADILSIAAIYHVVDLEELFITHMELV